MDEYMTLCLSRWRAVRVPAIGFQCSHANATTAPWHFICSTTGWWENPPWKPLVLATNSRGVPRSISHHHHFWESMRCLGVRRFYLQQSQPTWQHAITINTKFPINFRGHTPVLSLSDPLSESINPNKNIVCRPAFLHYCWKMKKKTAFPSQQKEEPFRLPAISARPMTIFPACHPTLSMGTTWLQASARPLHLDTSNDRGEEQRFGL